MKNKIIFLIKGLRITPNFKENLTRNFHALTSLEMLVYFIFIRPFWGRENRFFFEGSLPLLGQMSIAERKVLFSTIKEKRPRHCFEIGTYTGGGSTYFLAKAFESIGEGKIVTMESDSYYYKKAKEYYTKKIPKIGKHTEFIFGSKAELFDGIINSYGGVDCVFLDGAEESGQTLEQYNYFLPYFHVGSILMLHDWNTEKTRMIKPILNNNKNWRKIIELNPPISVGMVVFERI